MTLKIQNNDKFKEIQCLALIISLSWYENVQKELLLEKYKFKLVIPKRRGLFVRCTYYNTHKEYNVMMMQKNETPRLFYCRMGKSLLKTAENSQFYRTTQFLCNSFSQNNLYKRTPFLIFTLFQLSFSADLPSGFWVLTQVYPWVFPYLLRRPVFYYEFLITLENQILFLLSAQKESQF